MTGRPANRPGAALAGALPDNPVLMGVFGAAVGLKGEIRLKSHTADPAAIADYGPLFARDGRRFVITSLREANDVVVVRIEGIADRTAAEALTNTELFVGRAALGEPAEEDEFFHADLIGLIAETAAGEAFGTVTALHDFGAGTMIEIRLPSGPSVAYPFTRAVVPVIDLAGRRVVLVPPVEIDGDAD